TRRNCNAPVSPRSWLPSSMACWGRRRYSPALPSVWQCSTIAWIAGGVLLIAASLLASDAARHWIIATVGGMYAFGAIANAYATRGRHFGWMALGAVTALAAAAY